MDCDRCLELMSQALDGPLSPAQQEELSAHLNICPDCAALYRELTQQSSVLRSLDPPFPEGLHQRILDHLPARQQPKAKGMLVHLRRWGALAACAALVVALGVIQPWSSTGAMPEGARPNMASLPNGADRAPDPGVYAGSRSQESESPESTSPLEATTDTRIVYTRLPEGWQDIVGTGSPEYARLSGEAARAFLELLEEQGIAYTVEGDETFSGDCVLVPAEP